MPDHLTAAERSMRARLAAYTLHATHDAQVTTAPGRRAFLESFEHKVDPDGTLPEPERQRRAAAALKAHMTRLALASAKARREAS